MDLRISTPTTVWLGPFKSTDGLTSSTGSTAIFLIAKNNGNFIATTGVNPQSTGVVAWFKCPLTATNLNALGILTIAAQSSSAYLDVWGNYNVVTANYWDTRYGTDVLDTNIVSVGGATSDADDYNALLGIIAKFPTGDIAGATEMADLNNISTTDVLTQVNASTGVAGTFAAVAGLKDVSTTDLLTQGNISNLAGVNLIEVISSTSATDEMLNMFDGTGYAGGDIRLQADWVETNGSTEIDTDLTPAIWAKEMYSKTINDSYKDSNEYKFYTSTGAYLFSLDIATTSRTRSS